MSIFVQPVSNRLELLSQLFLGARKWMNHKLNRGHLDLLVAQQFLLLCSWLAAAKLWKGKRSSVLERNILICGSLDYRASKTPDGE